MKPADRAELVSAMAEAGGAQPVLPAQLVSAIEGGEATALSDLLAAHMPESDQSETEALATTLRDAYQILEEDHELKALLRALDGRFIPPV
jgi:magnesium chelatase subunit H